MDQLTEYAQARRLWAFPNPLPPMNCGTPTGAKLTAILQIRFVPSTPMGGRMIVTEHGEGIRRLVFHQRRIWRWASFDPPFRNPGLGGSCIRKVLCSSCGEPLGSADDPVD